MKHLQILVLLTIQLTVHQLFSQTIVETHGHLSIDGTHIVDEFGSEVQLRGMSYFWHQWDNSAAYWNEDVIKWLRDDWKVQIVRAAVGVRPGTIGDGNYLDDPEATMTAVKRLLDACIAQDMYVIVDWHCHTVQTEEAQRFFSELAQEYGQYPNILWEIFNEPEGESWDDYIEWTAEIKPYAEELIATIREHDPDNIIIVGTPFYAQFVHEAAADPITVDANGNPVSNIAYTVHAYAGSHKETQRDWAQQGLDAGLCLIMTEFDRTDTDFSSPDQGMDMHSWQEWIDWADQNKITWCNWSLGIKDELNSALYPSARTDPTIENGGWDILKDLRESGRWKRAYFRSANAAQITAIAALSTEDVQLFPNPSNGKVRIKLPQVQLRKIKIELLDVNGKSVVQEVPPTNQTDYNLTVPSISGQYFIRISYTDSFGHDRIVTKKVIISEN